ncbi:uncharacterized protein LOC131693570 [Topomyia yanbarensis]|uniref:uncharacterized protein LOC131692819 n=1 Tax=Topomyia yanbarensis TaxID=2498891 RepID=UPI00273B1B1C|nr:uncharacterized protein LOC131692819 [Topomyia yanbarensis]XP_058837476.1 uncharacterized protein LOC131693570 [Topomyia yanbarensis]
MITPPTGQTSSYNRSDPFSSRRIHHGVLSNHSSLKSSHRNPLSNMRPYNDHLVTPATGQSSMPLKISKDTQADENTSDSKGSDALITFSKHNNEPPSLTTEGLELVSTADMSQLGDNRGDICDADSNNSEDGDEAGDATLLNDFSLFEYFQSYHHETLINETDSTDISDEEELGLGFKEFEAPSSKKRDSNSKNKDLKERGLEYTRSNGKKAPARSIKAPCECSKMACHLKYNADMREKMLKSLLQLKSSGQNQFLSSHIDIKYAAKHRVSKLQFNICSINITNSVGF